METILQDLRYAARSLRRQPGLTAIAVFTLAVGIGANTAIYSVVDATLLRRLPFREPGRLMRVSLASPAALQPSMRDDMIWSYPKYEFFRARQQSFEESAVYRAFSFNLTGTDEPEQLRGEQVGAAYFPVLGVEPQVGRTFRPEEDAAPGCDLVAVLSHGLWERRFGADPGIAGKTIGLDRRAYTIVGVAPAGFQGLTGPTDVWIPAHAAAGTDITEGQSHSWECVARLRAGIDPGRARSEVEALGPRISEAFPPRSGPAWGAKARTLAEARIDPAIRQSVLVLYAAVTFVLMIACVNVANLLLARGTSRQREIAVRQAVGANRLRLVRQLLTESVLLSSLGAAASLLLAGWGVHTLSAINPVAGSPFGRRVSGLTVIGLRSIRLDSSALLFTIGIALLTGILFGLAPALQASRGDVWGALKSARGRDGFGGRNGLVVIEVALATVLLIGAGLMIKSFGRLLATRSGVDPENVLTVRVSMPGTMSDAAAAVSFYSQLEARAAALPGVAAAGSSNCYALAGGCNGTIITFPGRPPVPRGSEPPTGVHFVSPGYFRTMKIPLLRGRWFTGADGRDTPKVIVISQLAAQRFWPGEDPIGKRAAIGQGGFADGAEVIGIVGDVRYGQLDESPKPDVYISHLQSPRFSMMLFVRTAGNPALLSGAIQREVRALHRDLPAYDIKTMAERVHDSTARARFSATLLAVFAAIALILAAVGIYGVMSCLVTQRTHEIGIRIALGAASRDVLALVVGRGALLAAAGVALGVGAALAATKMLTALLYEVKSHDLETYATIAAVLVAVALLASYIPARRASAVDPSLALRA